MNELIVIKKEEIGKEEVNAVDARELWKFLEVKSTFPNWISDRIKQYDFVQGTDFIGKKNSAFSPPRKDCIISIDMAKELSMV